MGRVLTLYVVKFFQSKLKKFFLFTDFWREEGGESEIKEKIDLFLHLFMSSLVGFVCALIGY